MKQIFILSGLGTDERVFKHIEFPGCQTTYIKWIEPLDKETLAAYAKRLTQQITANSPVLVGLSFGGIVATEISKLIATEKLILIASVKTRKEIPFFFRISGKLNLHKLMPSKFFTEGSFISNWLFGIETESDKKLLSEILHDTDPMFFKWAINEIVKWDNAIKAPNITHIHGTADRIFPYRFVQADHTIKNGGHFMTVNRSAEINSILKTVLY